MWASKGQAVVSVLATVGVFVSLLLSSGARTAAGKVGGTCQNPATRLNPTHVSQLNDLADRLNAGEPFSQEESQVLQRFMKGESIAVVEADAVINRVLYLHYIERQPLDQAKLALFLAFTKFRSQAGEDPAAIQSRAARLATQTPETADVRESAEFIAAPANDRICNALAVLQPSAAPRSTSRQCFSLDTSGATGGPFTCDVVNETTSFLDTWYKITAPHPCAAMQIQVQATHFDREPAEFVIYRRGGVPYFVAEVPCGSGCNQNYFDNPRVTVPGGTSTFTLTGADASKDLYFEVNAGGTQNVCFTLSCP